MVPERQRPPPTGAAPLSSPEQVSSRLPKALPDFSMIYGTDPVTLRKAMAGADQKAALRPKRRSIPDQLCPKAAMEASFSHFPLV
ncbi:hypothetical protein SAMN05216367_5191 [Tardiphaga sp. OK245]|nr:hypothetical protein SAMN05216367_5191 [Tardiphaga sp. OK245]